MKKTYKSILIASILSLTVGGAAIAGQADCKLKHRKHHHSQMRKGPHAMHMLPPMKPFYLKSITLDAAQEDQVFALTHASIPDARARMKQQKALRLELVTLIQSGEYTAAKSRKLAENLANIVQQHVLAKSELDNHIFSLLTDDQKKQVREHRKRHVKHDREKSGRAHHAKQSVVKAHARQM